MQSARDAISELLRVRHGIGTGDSDDFSIFDQTQLLEAASSISGTLTLLLGGIASIALIVGGIGIMNIMLVSVRERTREIGIRKALGARRRDILSQFLIEALTLSLIGGLIGVLAGLVVSARHRPDRRLGLHLRSHHRRRRHALQPGRRHRLRRLARPAGGPPRSRRRPPVRVKEPTVDQDCSRPAARPSTPEPRRPQRRGPGRPPRRKRGQRAPAQPRARRRARARRRRRRVRRGPDDRARGHGDDFTGGNGFPRRLPGGGGSWQRPAREQRHRRRAGRRRQPAAARRSRAPSSRSRTRP